MTIDPGKLLLEHYVVKGMKWGVRRSQAQLDRSAGRKQAKSNMKSAKKDYKKARKEAIRDVRSRSNKDMMKRDQEHAAEIVKVVSKYGDKTLVAMGSPGGGTMMMSGKDFVDNLAKGGAFSPAYTTIVGPKGSYNNERYRTRFSADKEKVVNEKATAYESARKNYKESKRR